jgi:hypothetical protein
LCEKTSENQVVPDRGKVTTSELHSDQKRSQKSFLISFANAGFAGSKIIFYQK